MKINYLKITVIGAVMAAAASCKPGGADSTSNASFLAGDAAERVYVKPGTHDEFYNIVSGGFNGQLSVVGLPSGRTLKIIPVFSQFAEMVGDIQKKQSQC